MRIFRGKGVGKQETSHYSRDNLPANQEYWRKTNRRKIWTTEELVDADGNPKTSKFIPSFAILRHLHQDDEARWGIIQSAFKADLGRNFTPYKPEQMTIKSIEQKSLINFLRKADSIPDPETTRGIAFNIRDSLTEALKNSPDPLTVSLGRVGVFGSSRRKIGLELDGWRGWSRRYALLDDEKNLTAPGALLVERQIAIGGISMAFDNLAFKANDLAGNPHLTIGTFRNKVTESDIVRSQRLVNELGIDHALFGDPVISMKLSREEESIALLVRHAYDSLAVSDY